MRVIYIYILSVCLLLFGGYRYTHAAVTHNYNDRSSSQTVEKVPQVRYTGYAQHNAITNTISANEKFSVTNVETEDDDLSLSHKLVLERTFVALVYAAFLLIGFKILTQSLYSHRLILATSPSKYLALGALRI